MNSGAAESGLPSNGELVIRFWECRWEVVPIMHEDALSSEAVAWSPPETWGERFHEGTVAEGLRPYLSCEAIAPR